MFSRAVQAADRSDHACALKLKSLQEKTPYILFLCSVRQIGVPMCPLKSLYTREKSLHIISMFSWVVHDTGGSARVLYVALEKLTQEKYLFYMLCALKKAYTREKSLHIIIVNY